MAKTNQAKTNVVAVAVAPPPANQDEARKQNQPAVAKVTLAELQAKLIEAGKAGNIDASLEAARAIAKFQREHAEEMAKAAEVEAKKLAGVRLDYENFLTKTVMSIKGVGAKLAELKATGFHANLMESGQIIVKLAVPTVSIKRKGGGGAGKTQTSAGGLDASFQAIATAEEKAEYATKVGNSQQWAYKNKVVKAAIASGKLTPKA